MGRVSKERRAETLGLIETRRKVSEVSGKYGIHEATVRSWIDRTEEGDELLELSRLKRENEALLSLISRLTDDKTVRGKNGCPSLRT